jgi:hypothetical protein
MHLWAGLTAGDRYHLGGSARSDENEQALADSEGQRGQQKGNERSGFGPILVASSGAAFSGGLRSRR